MKLEFPEGWKEDYGHYIYVTHEEVPNFLAACKENEDTPYHDAVNWIKKYCNTMPGVYFYRADGIIHIKAHANDDDPCTDFCDMQPERHVDLLSVI